VAQGGSHSGRAVGPVTGVKLPGWHGAIYDAAARAKGTTVPPPATRLKQTHFRLVSATAPAKRISSVFGMLARRGHSRYASLSTITGATGKPIEPVTTTTWPSPRAFRSLASCGQHRA